MMVVASPRSWRCASSARSRSSAATRGGVFGDAPVGGDGRAVVGLEVVAERVGGGEPVHRDCLPPGIDSGDAVAQQCRDVVFGSPEGRRLRARRGGAAYGFMAAKHLPDDPSGVQLSNPIVPPARQTRTISSALA